MATEKIMPPEAEFWDLKWESLSIEEQREIQLSRLKSILKYVSRENLFYRKRFKDAGFEPEGIRTPEDFLKKAPFISKTILMDEQARKPPYGDLLSVPAHEIVRLYHSPGPLLIILSRSDLKSYIERAAMGLYLAGARSGDVVDVSFNYNWVGAGTQHDDAYRRIGCAVLPGGAGMSETHVELMKLTRATVLSAFPTYAIHLCETAIKMGVDPVRDMCLRLIIIVGEIRTDDDKKRIGELFGAEVREMYVGNEMGFVGAECPYGGGVHLYSDTLVSVIDPNTGLQVKDGESGEIVTSDLHRKAMPILNYRTGDITEGISYAECPCGRKSPKMKRILGRVGDIPRVKGMFIPPRRVELVLNSYKDFGRYQLVIDRPNKADRLTIRIECPEIEQNDEFRKNLVGRFKIALGILPEIAWSKPGEIAADAPKILDHRKVE